MKGTRKYWRNLAVWTVGVVLGIVVLMAGSPVQAGTVVAQKKEFRYRYVSLNEAALPPGFLFFEAVAINNSGRVYGNAYDDSFLPHVAVYSDGVVTIIQEGIVYAVNEHGTVGGSVLVDPENFIEQAALFRSNGVELITRQPGEVTSFVTSLNDFGSAVVVSLDASFQPTHLLFKGGQSTPLDFGPTVTNPFSVRINNSGIIAGTQGDSLCEGATGFRFDTRRGETALLHPLPTEPAAWALGINNQGHVLGYSFVCGGIERIGIWGPNEKFNTYFVEGTPEFPTISNHLVFNNNNLIVITLVVSPDSERGKSYLVPQRGVRVNLADLVENLPDGADLIYIRDLNDRGSMIGFGSLGAFLLERFDEDEDEDDR
jgi:hypothetical protein